MKKALIICAAVLLGLLWLVLSKTKREGFVILLDKSYHAEITAGDEAASNLPASQTYETVVDEELRRAVEEAENFTPEFIFQYSEAVYLTE